MKKPSTLFWVGMGYALVLFLVHIPCGGEWPHARCFVNPDWDISRLVRETIFAKVVLFPYWLIDRLGEMFQHRAWSALVFLGVLFGTALAFAVVGALVRRLLQKTR